MHEPRLGMVPPQSIQEQAPPNALFDLMLLVGIARSEPHKLQKQNLRWLIATHTEGCTE